MPARSQPLFTSFSLLFFTLVLLSSAVLSPALAALPAPTLLSPENGTTTTTPNLHLQWEPLFGPPDVMDTRIAEYEVEIISASPSSSPLQSDSPAIMESVHAVISRMRPVQPLKPGTYTWRVRATAPDGSTGPWSEAWELTVRPPKNTIALAADSTMMEMAQAFIQASAQGDTLVTFAPGARRVDPQGATLFVNITNTHDVIVDGQGASLTFTSYLTFLYMHNCTRCSLRNVAFDLDPPPYAALHVTALTGDNATSPAFVAVLDPGHPEMESNAGFAAPLIGGDLDTQLLRPKRGVTEVLSFSNWTRLNPGRPEPPQYRLDLQGAGYQGVAAGDTLYFDPRIDPGLRIEGGEDAVLYNVTVFSCANECFTSQHAEGLGILACNMLLKPGRFLAANNGGHNHHSARLGVWIDSNVFESTGDDMCHVSGLVSSVATILNETTMLLQPSIPDIWAHSSGGELGYAVGDTLAFWNRQTSTFLSTPKIVDIQAPNSQGHTQITLDRSPGPVVPGCINAVQPGALGTLQRSYIPPRSLAAAERLGFNDSVTQVFNLNRTANQLVFRRNTYRNGRRVALLAKGYRALIENNFVQGTGGGGLELWPAPYEGLCASQYVVRNNFYNDTNQLLRTSAPIWATAFGGDAKADTCHRQLLFINNTIHAGPGSAVLLSDVDGAVFRHSAIERCGTDPEGPVSASNTENLVFGADNRVVNSTAAWLCQK